jgi:hypothetical protein
MSRIPSREEALFADALAQSPAQRVLHPWRAPSFEEIAAAEKLSSAPSPVQRNK